jgi:hypothetical protein
MGLAPESFAAFDVGIGGAWRDDLHVIAATQIVHDLLEWCYVVLFVHLAAIDIGVLLLGA